MYNFFGVDLPSVAVFNASMLNWGVDLPGDLPI